MLDSNGLMTAPCGVPASGVQLCACSPSRPCFRYCFSNFSTRPSRSSPSPLHQSLVRDRVEVAFQVRVDYPRVPCFQQLFDPCAALLAPSSRSEPIAMFRKLSLEDRFQHVRSAVCTTRSRTVGIPSGRFSLLPGLGIHYPPHRLRLITSFLQRARQFLQFCCSSSLLEHRYRLVVHSGCPAVAFTSRKRRSQVRRRVHLIYQTEPFASFDPVFQGRQHPFRPDRRFHPRPASRGSLRLV